MTNLEALKALYVALGGSSSTVAPMERSCDVIYAMAQIIPSNAFNQLPAVTASDNGSVLKVIDGAWGIGTDNVAQG